MRIGIVGLGLIGGSLGAAFRARKHHVCGFDTDGDHAEVALWRGLVDEIAGSVATCARERDVVILATPLAATLTLIPEVAGAMTPDAILTDACSVKKPVVEVMEAMGSRTRAVGGHPIAGKETGGPNAAEAGIFEGAAYALVPTSHSDGDALTVVGALVEEIGATPVIIEADEHDRILARSSHLPQVLSSALACVLGEEASSQLSGSGLRDMTRLAASNPQLWAEILTANAANVAPVLHAMACELVAWSDHIQFGDANWIERRLGDGKQAVSA